MTAKRNNKRVTKRRGAVAAFSIVAMVPLLGMTAIALDVGMLYVAHTEAQSSSDAASLAGAWELLNDDRIMGDAAMDAVLTATRQEAQQLAGMNLVLRHSPTLDLNTGNAPDGDVVIGQLSNLTNMNESLNFGVPSQFNTVVVRVQRDSESNGPVTLWFANALGIDTADLRTVSVAAFEPGIVGFRIDDPNQTSGLLPFTLHEDPWLSLVNDMLTNGGNYPDSFTFDESSGLVYAGADGRPELNIYPGSGIDQLPAGNFGTIDIGSPSNSTSDIARQVLQGVYQDDLSYFGGEFTLANGPLYLSGDTGLSAGFKDELTAVIGQARTLPLFDQVTGVGENSVFRIVSFAGIRIMDVKFTGSMTMKKLVIQPAVAVDNTAIGGSNTATSQFVYSSPRIVR